MAHHRLYGYVCRNPTHNGHLQLPGFDIRKQPFSVDWYNDRIKKEPVPYDDTVFEEPPFVDFDVFSKPILSNDSPIGEHLPFDELE